MSTAVNDIHRECNPGFSCAHTPAGRPASVLATNKYCFLTEASVISSPATPLMGVGLEGVNSLEYQTFQSTQRERDLTPIRTFQGPKHCTSVCPFRSMG